MLHEHGFDIHHTIRTQKNLDEHSVKDQTVIWFLLFCPASHYAVSSCVLDYLFVSAVNSESAQKMRPLCSLRCCHLIVPLFSLIVWKKEQTVWPGYYKQPVTEIVIAILNSCFFRSAKRCGCGCKLVSV